jgi:hypothetical protein
MKNLSGIAKITRTLASKSSMNPTLILSAIVVPLAMLFGFLSSGVPQMFFLGIASAVVFVALMQIAGFSIFAPYRLDDHSHIENMLVLSQEQARVRQGDTTLLRPDQTIIESNPLLEGETL